MDAESQSLRYPARMTTPTDRSDAVCIADAADTLGIDADALLDEIRAAAAAAERPSARD